MILSYRMTIAGNMQLPKGRPVHGMVELSTPSTNSAAVYLAPLSVDVDSPTARFGIPAGRHFPLHISELSELWLSGTDNDILDIFAEIF